jgi:hypothetical protein
VSLFETPVVEMELHRRLQLDRVACQVAIGGIVRLRQTVYLDPQECERGPAGYSPGTIRRQLLVSSYTSRIVALRKDCTNGAMIIEPANMQ